MARCSATWIMNIEKSCKSITNIRLTEIEVGITNIEGKVKWFCICWTTFIISDTTKLLFVSFICQYFNRGNSFTVTCENSRHSQFFNQSFHNLIYNTICLPQCLNWNTSESCQVRTISSLKSMWVKKFRKGWR